MSEKNSFNVLPTPPRISRDEMNLAEFPLTILSTRSNPKIKTLEFSDSIKNKSGESINRKWIITAADKFGLPTSSDDEVLLGLLKLTVDSGVKSPKIYFTRYEMLKTLKWTTEGRSYSRLQNALDRLSGVRIKATNAFYDNETKAYSTKNFGILDAYEINDGRDNENKKSFFIWSEVIFKSFQVGFIKKLDLDFYLHLQSSISKRIYRYLDKHFWYKSRVQINLFTFVHEKIGISRNYRYVSSIRQQIDPAIEELIKTGFLSACEYMGKGQGTEIILYSGKTTPRVLEKRGILEKKNLFEEGAPDYKVIQESRGVSAINHEKKQITKEAHRKVYNEINDKSSSLRSSKSEFEILCSSLEERGIQRTQAEKILQGKEPSALQRVSKIISYFDTLVSNSSPHVSRNPAGFLYRAVENPYQFNLPGEIIQKRLNSKSTVMQAKFNFRAVHEGSRKEEDKKNRDSFETLQSQYLVERKQQIQKLRRTVDSGLLSKINVEVSGALSKLKGLISELRFNEAVEHGIDERLAKLFAIPDFEEWVKSKRVIH